MKRWDNRIFIRCSGKGLTALFCLLAATGLQAQTLTASFSINYTDFAAGYPVSTEASISGPCSHYFWYWDDGTTTENHPAPFHAYAEPGSYTIVLFAFQSNSTQIALSSTNVTVTTPAIHYVATDSTPMTPYTNWETAASVIQDAVDIANSYPGTLILVSNGVYNSGLSVVSDDTTSNRVTVTKPLNLKGLNGPALTAIQGMTDPAETNVRCLYLGTGACVSGFTIKDGCCQTTGGGILCASNNYVSNCHIISNTAPDGGGIINGTLEYCTLLQNAANYGAGAHGSTIYDCLLQENTSVGYGGGGAAYQCTLKNCKIIKNQAESNGGGASESTLIDCYASGNNGWEGRIFYDCIIQFSSNVFETPDYHLRSFSPCINRGSNAYAVGTTDLDGNARIQGGIVDIGAFEYDWTNSQIPADWLAHFGLPDDGSADQLDSDGDGISNRQEWRCHTCPTNANSLFNIVGSAVMAATNRETITLQWSGQQGASYAIRCCPSLTDSATLTTIASNIAGQTGTMTWHAPATDQQAFYLISVE